MAELQVKVDDLTGDIVQTGSCGKDVYDVLYSNGKLLLRGNGATYDYSTENISPFKDNEKIKSLVVCEGITEIGTDIFRNTSEMKEVFLPDSLVKIKSSAFSQSRFNKIIIPKNLTALESTVFWSSSINSLEVPESVKEIGRYCCDGCSVLSEAYVYGSVVGDFMFTSCT